MAHDDNTNGDKNRAGHQPASRRGAITDFLLVLLVLLVAGGERVPDVNEAHYLTRLKHFWDPDWIRGDLFLDSPDAHLTVVLLFGWTTRWLPLAAVAWLGRLLSWTLIAWAWRRLSWRVVPRWGLAPLTAALWCVGVRHYHFAGEWVVGGFEAKTLAYGFVLAALGSLLSNQWNRVWLLLGLATAFHVLVGGWSTVLLAGLWLLERPSWQSLRAMAPGLAAGAAIGSAGVLPPLWMNAGVPAETASAAASIYVYERLAHHLAPLSKGWLWLSTRMTAHLWVLAFLTATTLWARRTNHAHVRRLCRYAWGAAGLAAVGLAIEGLLAAWPERAAGLLRYYWFRTTDFAAPLAGSLGFGAWLSGALAKRRPLAPVGLAAAALLATVYLAPAAINRVLADAPPADKAMLDHRGWLDACRWAKEETAPGALFLTPRRSHTFHWRAERPEVVVYKNVPQDAASLIEWRRRMWEVHRRPDAGPNDKFGWTITPGALGAQRLRRLADEYGFEYVLSDRRRPASLPIAYRNRSYVVYDMRRVAPPRIESPAASPPAAGSPTSPPNLSPPTPR